MKGYRSYSLRDGRLYGVKKEWTSAVFEAECFGGDILDCPMETSEEHHARHMKDSHGIATCASWYGDTCWHGCGVHSFKDEKDLIGHHMYTFPSVLAEVESYGRVDEFDTGYRSSHCRIMRMTLHHEWEDEYANVQAQYLQTKFGVPVSTTHTARPDEYIEPVYVVIGGSSWPTLASASSGTTTFQSQPQPPSGSQPKYQSLSGRSYTGVWIDEARCYTCSQTQDDICGGCHTSRHADSTNCAHHAFETETDYLLRMASQRLLGSLSRTNPLMGLLGGRKK